MGLVSSGMGRAGDSLFSLVKSKLRVLGCRQSGFLMNTECQNGCHKSQKVARLRRHVGPLCTAQNLLSVGPGCLPERSHAFRVRTSKRTASFLLCSCGLRCVATLHVGNGCISVVSIRSACGVLWPPASCKESRPFPTQGSGSGSSSSIPQCCLH